MITSHFIVPLGYRIKLGLIVKQFLNMKGLCGDIWLKMKMVKCIATTEIRLKARNNTSVMERSIQVQN